MKELETILNKSSFIDELNILLKEGGVIAFVTDTVWGLGCLPDSKKGVDKIYEIKGRDRAKPLILMSNNIENLFPYVKLISKTAENLMEEYFPGALTIVMEKSENTQDFITSGKNTVGIRVPNNEFFKKLCSVIDGHVLATTSANLSHQPSAKNYEQALENMQGLADLVIPDYGCVAKGLESTVVGVMNNELRLFRQGEIKIDM